MASYAAWNGKLDYNTAIKDINNASSIGAARSVVKQIMDDATKLGVTNNDQIAVANVLAQFASKYNLSDDAEMVKLINSWDPSTKDFKSANAFNAGTRVSNDYTTLQNIISSYNYNANGATTKKTEADVIKENTSPTSGRVSLPGYDSNGNKSNSTTSTTTPVNNTGGGGSVSIPGYSTINQAQGWTDEQFNKIMDAINNLKPADPLTAEELAELHDIDYNEQHILDEYNERTNQYYQDAIDEYYNLRNNLVGQASRNNQRTINDYLGEWANAAPTAARRGELAANALSAYMNSNYDLNAEDYMLNQAQNGLRSEWDAELAANPNTARQQYNAMGTTLASLSANLNTSQVKQYIDQLDAYSQMYAANRAISAAAAQGVASQYAGLANAAATNASTTASKYNSWQQLYNYYRNAYGATDKQASSAVTNNLRQSSGVNNNT